MGPLRQGHRAEAARRIAPDLLRAELGVGEVGDAQGDDAVGVGRVPRLEVPVVERAHEGEAERRVRGVREQGSGEAGDHGREVQRRPGPVDVHVLDALVYLVAARANLLEADGLRQPVLAWTPRRGREPDLMVELSLPLPDLVAFFGFHDLRGLILELALETSLEGVAWLDQVIVDGDERVLHLSRLGVRQEPVRLGLLDAELDHG